MHLDRSRDGVGLEPDKGLESLSRLEREAEKVRDVGEKETRRSAFHSILLVWTKVCRVKKSDP